MITNDLTFIDVVYVRMSDVYTSEFTFGFTWDGFNKFCNVFSTFLSPSFGFPSTSQTIDGTDFCFLFAQVPD